MLIKTLSCTRPFLFCLTLGLAILVSVAGHAGTLDDVANAANRDDFQTAFETLETLAENGNAKAQGFLGFVFYSGEWGVQVNTALANSWTTKALKQQDPFANLFVAMSDQANTSPPLPSIENWQNKIETAARAGHPYAQNLMGNLALGAGDRDAAVEWFHKATASGCAPCASNVVLAQDWPNNPRDLDVALLENSASAGNATGFVTLATAYTFGINTPVDYQSAYKALLQAHFLGKSGDKRFMTIFRTKLTMEMRDQLTRDALDQLFSWAEDPRTYIGKAAAFCYQDAPDFLPCLKTAIPAHQECEAPYTGWNFKNYTDFPAYKNCRKTFSSPSQ